MPRRRPSRRRWAGHHGPAGAAVGGEGDVITTAVALADLATHGHADEGVAEGDAGDTGGLAGRDGDGRDGPRPAAVVGAQHPRAGAVPGADQGAVQPQRGHRHDAGAAGGETALARLRRRQPGRPIPAPAAVVGHAHHQAAVHRVAVEHPAVGVPEGHAVVEAGRIRVGVEQGPAAAAVGGGVDAGQVARAGAEQEGGVGAHRLDVAELEGVGAGNPAGGPARAAVHSARPRAAMPAHPRHPFVDRAHGLEERGRAAPLRLQHQPRRSGRRHRRGGGGACTGAGGHRYGQGQGGGNGRDAHRGEGMGGGCLRRGGVRTGGAVPPGPAAAPKAAAWLSHMPVRGRGR